VYRKDLFEAASLEPPTTFEAIQTAAEELNSGDQAGIVLATGNDLGFVQQTFEYFAVANGCDVIDGDGNVTITSPACVETFDFYSNLVNNGSVEGAQDADTTRAAYFAGDAAMIIWSSFILDELAGLRDDALPTCPECTDDPLFLAENSGVVTAIQGPSGSEPSQFGEMVSFVISDGAPTEAQQFVEFMMSDAYVDWLAIAPEGKFPTRLGSADNPTEYADAWGSLEAGVDRKEPLGEIYDEATLEALTTSADTMKRWAFAQGQGGLVGPLLTEVPVPNALLLALDGSMSAEEAATEAQAAIEELLAALE
jgi:multiple sugar transport system substrate-binding protein